MNLMMPASSFGPAISPISPHLEMGAYEALWLQKGASFKVMADRFRNDPTALPSDFVSPNLAMECANKVLRAFHDGNLTRFGVRVNNAGEYPKRLREARHPIELLYYRGFWEISETRSVAVVGSRKATEFGMARARKIAQELVELKYTVVSGLAEGIDTAAHNAAIEAGGRTIAVIGTPLNHIYPKSNADLQSKIAAEHLVISQVPVLKYEQQDYRRNRSFFPERNVTMSALTDATIIVEAGETSGTLTQARAALHQGRKLFILNSCFDKGLSWPERFEKKGAVRVKSMDDIWDSLE